MPDRVRGSNRILCSWVVFVIHNVWSDTAKGNISVVLEENILERKILSVDFWLVVAEAERDEDVAAFPHAFGEVFEESVIFFQGRIPR